MKKLFLLLSLLLVGCAANNTPNAATSQVSTQQSLATLTHTEHFTKSALAHIFEGEINKKNQAVGYHYEGYAHAKASVIEETRSKTNTNGIYRAKIKIGDLEKTAYSTFFPKTWSMQEVVDAINEAYATKSLQTGNIYNGQTTNGLTIQMYLTDDGKIISAFPIYKP